MPSYLVKHLKLGSNGVYVLVIHCDVLLDIVSSPCLYQLLISDRLSLHQIRPFPNIVKLFSFGDIRVSQQPLNLLQFIDTLGRDAVLLVLLPLVPELPQEVNGLVHGSGLGSEVLLLGLRRSRALHRPTLGTRGVQGTWL